MGIFSRVAAPRQDRREPVLAAPETRRGGFRNGSDGWGVASLSSGLTGAHASPATAYLAENLSAVLGAVELICGSLASLPATLIMDAPDGQVPAPATATGWALLARPSRWQSWPAFVANLAASMLLHGNGLAMLQRDGRGAVVGLVPIPWPWIMPNVVRGAGGARLVFDVVTTTPEAELLGLPRRLLDSDVLHIKARSEAGIIGRSVLSRAAGVVREGIDLATAAQALWANGLNLSGFLSTGGEVLTDAQRDRFRSRLNELRGAGNSGKTMLLEGAFSYNALSITPGDAELLGSRAFSVTEVARLFSIPVGLLHPGQASQKYEELLAAFAQLALAPIVAVIEQEFDEAALPPGLHVQLDMAGLLRGSFSGQVGAFSAGVQSGFLTPNDARRGLGLPAHTDGDALRPGNAPSWPADAKGMPHLGPSPGPTGTGLPDAGSNQNDGAA